MTRASAEETKVVIESALSLLRSQLAVFTEFVGDRGGTPGGGCGLSLVVVVAVVVVLLLAFVVTVVVGVTAGSVVVLLVVRFSGLVGLLRGVRFAFASAGLLVEMFPVTRINGVSECLHGIECMRFSLLTHNVLDTCRKSGVVAVTNQCE